MLQVLVFFIVARSCGALERCVFAGQPGRAADLARRCSALGTDCVRFDALDASDVGGATWLVWSADSSGDPDYDEGLGAALRWAKQYEVPVVLDQASVERVASAGALEASQLALFSDGALPPHDFVGDHALASLETISFAFAGVQGLVAHCADAAAAFAADGTGTRRRDSEAWCVASLISSFAQHAEMFRADAFMLRVVMPREQRRQLVVGVVLAAAALESQAALDGGPAETELSDFFASKQLPRVVQAEFTEAWSSDSNRDADDDEADDDEADDARLYVG